MGEENQGSMLSSKPRRESVGVVVMETRVDMVRGPLSHS